MPAPTVEVQGLRELNRSLKKLGDLDSLAEYKKVSREVAQLVIRSAKGKASTAMEKSAAATLKPSVGVRGVGIKLGGNSTPYALGAEFGAYRNQLRNTRSGPMLGWNQFRPWRGNDEAAGYFLWPAVRAESPTITKRFGDMIDKLWTAESAGSFESALTALRG